MRNQKKKGFTLIELIAVIAILAILGAVLVPKVAGYQAKAKRSNVQTAAKTMLNAIKAYNADATDANIIKEDAIVADAIKKVNDANGKDVVSSTGYEFNAVKDLTVGQLVTVGTGDFTLVSDAVPGSTASGNLE